MKKYKKIFTILKIVISISVLVFLVHKIGLSSILETLSKTNLLYLPIVFFLLWFSIFLGALNLKNLLSKVGIDVSSIVMFKCFLINTAVGWLLPGKVGSFSLPIFLKREDVPIGISSAVMIVDKVITVIVSFSVAIIGFSYFFGLMQSLKQIIAIVAILVLALIAGMVFIFSERIRGLFKKYILRKYAQIFKGFSRVTIELIKNHKAAIILNFIITIVKVLIAGIFAMLIFLSLGKYISIHYIIFIWGIEFVVSMIPITMSGLGIREAVGVYLYNAVGITPSLVMGRYVIGWIIRYTTAAASFLIYSKSIKTQEIKA